MSLFRLSSFDSPSSTRKSRDPLLCAERSFGKRTTRATASACLELVVEAPSESQHFTHARTDRQLRFFDQLADVLA